MLDEGEARGQPEGGGRHDAEPQVPEGSGHHLVVLSGPGPVAQQSEDYIFYVESPNLRCSPDGPADDDGQEAGDPHQQEGGEEGVDEGGDLEGVLAVEILEGRLQEVGQHDLRGREQQPDEEDKKVRGDDFCGEPGSFRLKITFNITIS